MAREKPMFRDNLERIDARFPQSETLKYDDLAVLFGYSRRTAIRKWSKFYNHACSGVPKTTVVRVMSGEG